MAGALEHRRGQLAVELGDQRLVDAFERDRGEAQLLDPLAAVLAGLDDHDPLGAAGAERQRGHHPDRPRSQHAGGLAGRQLGQGPAWTPTASGSTSAPCSSLTESGSANRLSALTATRSA